MDRKALKFLMYCIGGYFLLQAILVILALIAGIVIWTTSPV